MKGNGGHVLVELLVASACTALVGAGALSLLANGVEAVARTSARLEGVAVSDACRRALADDLAAATRGLEGAHSVQTIGAPQSRVILAPPSLRLLLSGGPPTEVIAEPGSRYRAPAGALADFRPGKLVAALPARDGAVAVGTVLSLESLVGEDRPAVRWSAPTPGPLPGSADFVRAVAPVRWREYALPTTDDRELRRRDDGPWQPVVSNLEAVSIDLVADVTAHGALLRIEIGCSEPVGAGYSFSAVVP
ncbi:MAG: hypothetical protein GKS06_04390 [Acidobacteria bacterium]|nr:hypothetical protein [Acidobacteriota bacterium]